MEELLTQFDVRKSVQVGLPIVDTSLKHSVSQSTVASTDSGFVSVHEDSFLSSAPSESGLTLNASLIKIHETKPKSRSKPQANTENGVPQELDLHLPQYSPINPKPSLVTYLLSYLCWFILAMFGLFRSQMLRLRFETNSRAQEPIEQRHFVPLYDYWETIVTQFIFRRLRDVASRPMASRPSAVVEMLDRVSEDYNWTFKYSAKTNSVINMGSYNYLGFTDSQRCTDATLQAVQNNGIALCTALHEFGHNDLHSVLEQRVAEFLGVEDAICCPMGFGTNTMNIPALVGTDALVLSDELNHASLILGCRASQAVTKVFKHNDPTDCERQIMKGMQQGNPLTGKAYSAILILVEGLYSMEGTIVHLPEFVALKNKYKAYLFMDEAHSIGALGRTGRGVCEYWGVPHTDVDVLMGTFTKSFSAAGGYVAGSRHVISRIRAHSHAAYAGTMAPLVATQIINAFDVLTGRDGTQQGYFLLKRSGASRLAQLRANTHYFRRRLNEAGFHLYGNGDSPVVPVLIYFPSKVAALSREMLKRHIAIVVVGFPATPAATERARFCLSSGHSRQQLDYVIENLIEAADMIMARPAK